MGALRHRVLWLVAAVGLAVVILPPQALLGASPEPSPAAGITMTAEPLLGGSFRPGSWAAVRVRLANDGPAINGELRISTAVQGSATYGIAVELAPGARQEHVVYGQTGPFRGRFAVSLISGSLTLANANVSLVARDADALGAYVVAERPQALVGPIRDALSVGGRPAPAIVSIAPEDLPGRVEVWSSVDLVVWQDVQSGRLDRDRVDALKTWVLMGGHLIVLGGTTGSTTLATFPDEMLPYRPTESVDVPVADLAALLGQIPDGAAPLPALAGTLARGTELASTNGLVTAARAPFGRGSVTLLGFDPSTPWLADSSAGDTLWLRTVPPGAASRRPDAPAADFFLVDAVGNLPAVQLPRLDQVFLLILAYVVAIGPLNYLVLRRRDRREWAWLTMPLTIAGFAVLAYGFGLAVKGPNVIVNQLSVVHGAAGTDRGLADVWVGVYSPSRSSFDVRVGGAPLISPPGPSEEQPATERAIDVLLGETSTVRDYAIGFGGLRVFRAHGMAITPRLDAQLSLAGDSLVGRIGNGSPNAVSDVALVYGDRAQVLGQLAPGAMREIRLATSGPEEFDSLSWRLFPPGAGGDPSAIRRDAARRAMVDHLAGGSMFFEGSAMPAGVFTAGPVILAWAAGGTFDIDIGTDAEQVGETVYVLPARVSMTGPVILSGGLIQAATIAVDADEGFSEAQYSVLSRGTMVVEYRPGGLDGVFAASALTMRLSPGPGFPGFPGADSEEVLAPLPEAEQPDQTDPLAANPRPLPGQRDAPRLQLLDHVQAKWIEFEPVELFRTYSIADPARFVDETGRFVIRFVVRGPELVEFSLVPRLAGTVK